MNPSWCELCGRSAPVSHFDVFLDPRLVLELDTPVICGNDCYMLPGLSRPARYPELDVVMYIHRGPGFSQETIDAIRKNYAESFLAKQSKKPTLKNLCTIYL